MAITVVYFLTVKIVIFWLVCMVNCNFLVYIQTLDKTICNSLENPKAGEGQKLSNELLQLYIALDDIHDMLRDNRGAGKRMVNKILDAGGLKLPSIKPNYPLIMRTYNWSTDKSKVLNAAFRDAIQMWKNVQIGMNIIPTTQINYALNPEKDKK